MATLLVSYKPTFIRQLKKLELAVQDEAFEKIAQFKNVQYHHTLGVRKLHGTLTGTYSFSVNFKYRIVFQHHSKTEVVLLAIGDHEVYR